jgi:hypothetical protein
MTHKKLQIVPQSSPPANPQKTNPNPAGGNKPAPTLNELIEKTRDIVGKNPDKAARVLSSWIKESTRKKAA